MKTYHIYFSMYGKKMRVSQIGSSEDDAKARFLVSINIHKIEVSKDCNDFIDQLKQFTDGFR